VDIRSPDSLTRQKAVSQFAKHTSPSEIDQLVQILESTEDDGVRASCADALRCARATRAVPALIEALEVRDWRVRRSAASALGAIADSRAIEPLIQVLTEQLSDPNLSEGRRYAICAFVNLKSGKVVPILMHMLTHNPGWNESERIDYTTALLAALGAQMDKRAIPVIADLLDGRAGSQAAAAIGRIVGVDFRDHDKFGGPQHSPAKAKAWLQKHPEWLTPTEGTIR
jgi:HEAT repeat protein